MPHILTIAKAVVDLVSNELGIPAEQLAEKLNSERRYIVIKREVPESLASALRAETSRRKFAWNLFRT